MIYAWGTVAIIALTALVMTGLSLHKAWRRIGILEGENRALENLAFARLEEIEALAAGDHGLSHDDFGSVLLPSETPD